MRTRNLMLILAVAAALAGQSADADVTLQRAIRKERVEGDLNGAIELYRKVIAGAGKNRGAAAKALLALGECYEKQGSADARRAYERLVNEFGDQDAAREARARLAAMPLKTQARSITAQLIARGPEVDLEGRVTPDGRLYVFVDQESGNLAVRDLKTGAVKRLTNEATGTETGDAHGHTPIPSRDGRQIAYVWYLSSAASATANRLEIRTVHTDGTGMHRVGPNLKVGSFYYVLDWFPDGKRILVSGVEPGATRAEDWLGLVSIDLTTGEEQRIATKSVLSGPVALSPEGRWLLFSKPQTGHDVNWDILAIDLQTGQETPILNGMASDRSPAWVPDTDKMTFRSDRTGKEGIWMVGFKNGQTVGEPKLVKPDAGDFTPAGVSRDGSLYYGISYKSTDVYTAAVDPETLRVQGTPNRLVESYIGHNMTPAWSPSGDSFAYFSEREANKGAQLIIRNPGGKEAVAAAPVNHAIEAPYWCAADRLLSACTPNCYTRQPIDARTGEALAPKRINGLATPYQLGYSPDCNSVYVSSYIRSTQQRRIYQLDVETGKQTEMMSGRGEWAISPRVSPDSRWLALIGTLEGGKKAGLLVLPTAGGALRMLASGADYGPTWTPDSKRLMYTQEVRRADGLGTENELYWVPVDGGTPQPMGIRMPHASAPSLNADGRRILFSAGESYNELWVLRNLSLK